jgi:HEAT repeat protein
MLRRILLMIPVTAALAFAQQPKQAPPPKPMVDAKYGSAADIMAMPAPKAVAILRDSSASVYARAKACQRLAVVGDRTAIAPLAALLTEPQLSHYARIALETNPDPGASEALRAALPKVQGKLLVGVIHSLGARKDKNAIEALGKLRNDNDTDVARAAEVALAMIRPTP